MMSSAAQLSLSLLLPSQHQPHTKAGSWGRWLPVATRALCSLFRSTRRQGINKVLLISASSGLSPPMGHCSCQWGVGGVPPGVSLGAEDGVAACTKSMFPERQDQQQQLQVSRSAIFNQWASRIFITCSTWLVRDTELFSLRLSNF